MRGFEEAAVCGAGKLDDAENGAGAACGKEEEEVLRADGAKRARFYGDDDDRRVR